MRLEYLTISIILVLIVLAVVLSFSTGIVPGFNSILDHIFGQIAK